MFTYHDELKSTEQSVSILKEAHAEFGFVPNMVRIMAESPAIYDAYKQTFEILFHKTTLSLIEAQVVLLTVSVKNRCGYDVAAHSWGMKMCKVSDDVIEAIRNGKKIEDTKLQELQSFTNDLIDSSGHLDSIRVQQFLDVGFTHQNVFEVVTGISVKTISNLTNNLVETQLDDVMNEFSWNAKES